MATVPPISRLAKTDNIAFLNAVRRDASSEYRSRIPEATQANIQDQQRRIWDYKSTRNEFIDAVINKVGLTIAVRNSFTNPLAKFKRGMLEFGDTIEEIAVGLAEARTYEHQRDYLEKDIFGQETPEVQAVYHKINRENFYKITVKDFAIKRAFFSPNGLSEFTTQLIEAATTSDQVDEFLVTANVLTEYDKVSGFYKIQIPDVGAFGSDEADAKYALRRMHEAAGNLAFMSRDYNAAKMPMTAMPEDLELILTPEANAAMNVEALAGAFNVDQMNFNVRKTIVPSRYIDIPGFQAILTTKDFFVIADTLFETRQASNPVGLYDNYFLHHHQIVSASPFAPAILFTTQPGTEVISLSTPVTGVNDVTVQDRAGVAATSLTRGDTYYIAGDAVTNPEGGVNDAVRFEAIGFTSPRSFVTQTGYLHASIDEAATSVVIRATSVDDNTFSKDRTLNIVGDRVVLGHAMEFAPDADKDGLTEVTPKQPAFNTDTNTVTIPTVKGVQYRKAGADVADKSTHVIAATTVFTAVAKTGNEIASGATASWTVVPEQPGNE